MPLSEPMKVGGVALGVGLLALYVMGKKGSASTLALGRTSNVYGAVNPQSATLIASENAQANATAAGVTLGLASIAGSLSTTASNNRTALLLAKQNGATNVDLANIAADLSLTSTEINDGATVAIARDTNAANVTTAGYSRDVQLANLSDATQLGLASTAASLAEQNAQTAASLELNKAQIGPNETIALAAIGERKDESNNAVTTARIQGKAAAQSAQWGALGGLASSALSVFGGGGLPALASAAPSAAPQRRYVASTSFSGADSSNNYADPSNYAAPVGGLSA